MLYEDAVDLARWFASLELTVPNTWCDEVVAAMTESTMEGFI